MEKDCFKIVQSGTQVIWYLVVAFLFATVCALFVDAALYSQTVDCVMRNGANHLYACSFDIMFEITPWRWRFRFRVSLWRNLRHPSLFCPIRMRYLPLPVFGTTPCGRVAGGNLPFVRTECQVGICAVVWPS
jgi:hypothetical protein